MRTLLMMVNIETVALVAVAVGLACLVGLRVVARLLFIAFLVIATYLIVLPFVQEEFDVMTSEDWYTC